MAEPDITDWPAAIPLARQLDEAARCTICLYFFNTPLSLPCGHSCTWLASNCDACICKAQQQHCMINPPTVCSECIRSSLHTREKSGEASCPQCRAPADTRDLRPNTALRTLVDVFVKTRPHLVEACSTQHAAESKSVEQHNDGGGGSGGNGTGAPTRRSSRGKGGDVGPPPPSRRPVTRRGGSQPSGVGASVEGGSRVDEKVDAQCDEDEDEQEDDAKSDSEYLPDNDDEAAFLHSNNSVESAPPPPVPDHPTSCIIGHVPCPVCGKTLPEAFLNIHLDDCLVMQAKSQPNHNFNTTSQTGMKTTHAGTNTTTVGHTYVDNTSAAAGVGGASGSGSGVDVMWSTQQHQQLKVPPKMLFRMMKDKPVRDTLKKYGLSSQGKREILQERYDAFRIEVQTANDKHERATYEQCARRVERKERQRQGLPFAAAVGGGNRAGMEAELELLQRVPSSFAELIEQTKQRDAKRRRLATAGDTQEDNAHHAPGTTDAAVSLHERENQPSHQPSHSSLDGGVSLGGVPRSPVLQPANGVCGVRGSVGGEGPLCTAGAASPSL